MAGSRRRLHTGRMVAEKNSGVSAQKMAPSERDGAEHTAHPWLENARAVASPGEKAQRGGRVKM
jgi:hypothetical protein